MNKRIVFKLFLTTLGLGFAIFIVCSTISTQASKLSSVQPNSKDPVIPTVVFSTGPIKNPKPNPEPSNYAQLALAYLAKREGTPASSFKVVTDHPTSYPHLGREFQVVTIIDTRPEGKFYDLLVDISTGEVIDDVDTIQLKEDAARDAKYGKLQPDLYEKLLTIKEDDSLTVTIWVIAGPGQSQAELEAAAIKTLSEKYPEAKAAVELGGKPMDVDDPDLAKIIYDEYIQLIEANVSLRLQPLIEMLEAEGVTPQTSEGLPAVTATLTKKDILLVAERNDVGTIYLAEGGQRLSSLNSAIPSDRTPIVWKRGYDGSGINIAILEDDTVDITSPDGSQCPASSHNCFLHPATDQQNGYKGIYGLGGHATLVASVAASNHSIYRGMTYGATIIGAGIQGPNRQDDINALVWAFDHNADVVNASYRWCFGNMTQMDSIDRAFDYYARNRFKMIAVSAGNNDANCPYYNVVSPGRGWNVLSIGAYADQNNANWPDDLMASFSDYVNPASENGDHEKPEVVAPGVDITGIGPDGVLMEHNNGTSLSAPQVAGLTAMLIHRNSDLRTWPEASRAIIMASAVHNIEGPSIILSGVDLKDGAGGIDASLAETIAKTHWTSTSSPCTGPCWWGLYINNTIFPVGNYLYRYFNASAGEQVRVAISWWSHADCPSEANCNYDRLDTDLQLGVKDPYGNWVEGAWSTSWDNNYEMVDFSAPITGKYTIAVYNQRESQDDPNYIGIAWTKQATYLPDLRTNYNGWGSKIYIRNDSPTDRYVSMSLFNSNGSGAGSIGIGPLPANYLFVLDLSFLPSFNGSAIIDASEDISVVVENLKTNVATNYAGILAPDQGGNPDWGQASTTLYAPAVKYNFYGRYTDLYIMNTGVSATNVTVAYYDDNGSYKGTRNCTNLAANARCVVTLPDINWGTFLAGRIASSSQPVAAIVFERDGAETQVSTHNAIAAGANTLYSPNIKRNWTPGQTSGLRIHNTQNNTAHVYVYYYDSQHPGQIYFNPNGYSIYPNGAITLAPDAYLPNPFYGSAVITSDSLVVAEVHETGSVRKMASNVFRDPGTLASYAVRICQNCGDGFVTGLRIQNIGTGSAVITIVYYDQNGNKIGSNPETFSLDQYWANLANQIPAGLNGSAVITATQPIAVVVNLANPNTGFDLAMTYSAPNR